MKSTDRIMPQPQISRGRATHKSRQSNEMQTKPKERNQNIINKPCNEQVKVHHHQNAIPAIYNLHPQCPSKSMNQNSNPQRHTQARQVVMPLTQTGPPSASRRSATSLPFVLDDFSFSFFFLLLLFIVVIVVIVWIISLIVLLLPNPLQINDFH